MPKISQKNERHEQLDEQTQLADAFVFQYRKHLSIFVMLVLGIIPVVIAVGRPWSLPVSMAWLFGLVGWYMVRGFRFRHRGRRYSYTISGGKYGPKYITDLETGEITEAQEFIRLQSFPHARIIILGLVMPMVLLISMIACGIVYMWLRVHLR
jgi:hypothetical protein